MLNIRLIWVGKSRQSFVKEGLAFFLKRLRPYAQVECVEVRSANHSGREAAAAVNQESEAILNRINMGERVILLDERGKALDSHALADWLAQDAMAGVTSVVFIIGGAHGVNEAVRQRADKTLSLSKMTLPHQLVRLFLVEQLYRASTLNAGHGYHHD